MLTHRRTDPSRMTQAQEGLVREMMRPLFREDRTGQPARLNGRKSYT